MKNSELPASFLKGVLLALKQKLKDSPTFAQQQTLTGDKLVLPFEAEKRFNTVQSKLSKNAVCGYIRACALLAHMGITEMKLQADSSNEE